MHTQKIEGFLMLFYVFILNYFLGLFLINLANCCLFTYTIIFC